tara:strand:- start:3413 stop:3601 length:189 start_codon:yes stop_codon:yes gene_type:complete
MTKLITKTEFLHYKKRQQKQLWAESRISSAELIDWLLAYGDDSDVEWLQEHFDPDDFREVQS